MYLSWDLILTSICFKCVDERILGVTSVHSLFNALRRPDEAGSQCLDLWVDIHWTVLHAHV